MRHSILRNFYYIKVFYVIGKALSGELSCTWTDLVCTLSVDRFQFYKEDNLGLILGQL